MFTFVVRAAELVMPGPSHFVIKLASKPFWAVTILFLISVYLASFVAAVASTTIALSFRSSVASAATFNVPTTEALVTGLAARIVK